MFQRILNWFYTNQEHRLILRKVRRQLAPVASAGIRAYLYHNFETTPPYKEVPCIILATSARDPKHGNRVKISSSIYIDGKNAAQILNELPDHLNRIAETVKKTKSGKEYPNTGGMEDG
jgi:hypothetical protein